MRSTDDFVRTGASLGTAVIGAIGVLTISGSDYLYLPFWMLFLTSAAFLLWDALRSVLRRHRRRDAVEVGDDAWPER